MAKSYFYVPGLAKPDLVGRNAAMAVKVAEAFQTMWSGSPLGPDAYMTGTIQVLATKGATPIDCGTSLRWIKMPVMEIKNGLPKLPPRPKGAPLAPGAKAFEMLGKHNDNILSKEAGVQAKALKTKLSVVLQPCTLPVYLAAAAVKDPAPVGTRARGVAVIAAPAPKALSVLKSGDTLFVVGHSNPQGGTISYKCFSGAAADHVRGAGGCPANCHCESWNIDPVTLGTLLIEEGLPNVALEIPVVACFAGGLKDETLQTVQSFAQRLAGTLVGRGYARVRVSGATGLTSPNSTDTEMQIAQKVTVQEDKSLLIDHNSKETMSSADGNKPFYQRFFRFFKG